MITVNEIAELANHDMYIQCKWASGDNEDFHNWLEGRNITEECGGHLNDVEGLLSTIQIEDDHGIIRYAESDYGGGSQACHWYDLGHIIIGLDTEGTIYLIWTHEEAPEITDYEEFEV